jgi:hypothetical protein
MGEIAWAETLADAKQRTADGRLLFTYIFSPG